MTMSTTAVPGYVAGTWTISPVNSEVRFTVRHLGVTKVHGRFNEITGAIITGDTLEASSVTATIAADSIDTGFPARDTYICGPDVLSIGAHDDLRFASTGVRMVDGSLSVEGNLTVRRVTKPVTLAVEVGGFGEDPIEHVEVLGLSATTTLRRGDFGFGTKVPPIIVGEDISVHLDIHAVRQL